MRLSVLGGCGAWPAADRACSGYLVEHDGFRLLVDPGYAVLPRLLRHIGPGDVDAVFVTHGHPDHCADLNPLLRARKMSASDAQPLTVYAPPRALDAVLALDREEWLNTTLSLREFTPGDGFDVGPFGVETRLLPHSVVNAGVRITAADRTIAYTGDTGPCPEIVTLARHAHVLLAEASYVDDEIPEELRATLSTARQAGQHASAADVGRLVLAHLIPGTEPSAAVEAAQASYAEDVSIATDGLVVDVA